MHFNQLGLTDSLLRAVQDNGYTTPTPIQERAIPPALAGRDVFGCAQTGTGKTAAFVLPILQHIAAEAQQRGPNRRLARALILTPTRELASQIGESIATYGAHLRLQHTVIYGGVGQHPQVAALRRGLDIIVACPGRLLDLMNQRHVDLSGVGYFVLDEADRMLDMGFIHDVKRIIAKIPLKRQTLFFSATVPKEIRQLADSLLKDPVQVEVTPVSSTAETVDQTVYMVGKSKKADLLEHLLQDPALERVLVFTRTKHGADRVAKQLTRASIRTDAIHGNKSQNARMRALEDFRSGKIRVLVASDIAARGIDIDGISHVVNFELSHEPETYVHRIGRTGRAGKSGRAISFCEQEEEPRLRKIQKLINRPIPVVTDHPFVGSDTGGGQRGQQSARSAGGDRRPGGGGSGHRGRRPEGRRSEGEGRPRSEGHRGHGGSGDERRAQRPQRRSW